jgi:hypothetical protein
MDRDFSGEFFSRQTQLESEFMRVLQLQTEGIDAATGSAPNLSASRHRNGEFGEGAGK